MARTGPKNLGGMGTGLKARGPAVRASRARTPSPRPGFTSGATPPMGGGQRRTGNPLRGATKRNSAKVGRPSSFNPSVRADGVSKI